MITNDEKERKEIEYWKNDPNENPNVFGINVIVNKMYEAKAFMEKVSTYYKYFSEADSILEIGGGQGWASCIVKNIFTESKVYSSDLSADAICSVSKWEKLFSVKIDNSFSCRSNEIPIEDSTVGLVFCFQAAHHFTEHEKTLKEIYRILKPGGVCLYLREPSCKKYIYPFAYRRVNKNRPVVHEDVLIYKEIIKTGQKCGFQVTHQFDTSCTGHHAFAAVYYYLLSKIKFLKYFLPCGSDFVFAKNDKKPDFTEKFP